MKILNVIIISGEFDDYNHHRERSNYNNNGSNNNGNYVEVSLKNKLIIFIYID